MILEQVRRGAGLTYSRVCGRVIIVLNHHIAIKPISSETAAKNDCFAPGNEEKETPGRPRFDIIYEILEELRELGFRSGQ